MQSSITVGMPEALAERLKKLVEAKKVTRNGVIREGIELVLKKYGY